MNVDDLKRILYGKSLNSYLVDIIGLELINKLERKPGVIVVKNQDLLKIREKINQPILCINKIEPGRHSKVTLFSHEKYPEDLVENRPLIEVFNENLKIDEPFERIEQLLEHLQLDENK